MDDSARLVPLPPRRLTGDEVFAGTDATVADFWRPVCPQRHQLLRLAFRLWDPSGGLADERTYNADGYVFAVHTCRDHSTYDVLDVSQWEFHVLAVDVLRGLDSRSLAYGTVLRLSARRVAWTDLAAAVATQTR